MKFTIIVFVVVIASAKCCQIKEVKTLPCDVKVKCSFMEDIVWSSDGERCIPFVNSCQFGNENCNRKKDNLPELKVVCKKECQTKCPTICPAVMDPVCGVRGDKIREFPNLCEMDAHICTKGEYYLLDHNGPC